MKTQVSLYRKVYMDIEREKVRDTARSHSHQAKADALKKDKERDRRVSEAPHAVKSGMKKVKCVILDRIS